MKVFEDEALMNDWFASIYTNLALNGVDKVKSNHFPFIDLVKLKQVSLDNETSQGSIDIITYPLLGKGRVLSQESLFVDGLEDRVGGGDIVQVTSVLSHVPRDATVQDVLQSSDWFLKGRIGQDGSDASHVG